MEYINTMHQTGKACPEMEHRFTWISDYYTDR